MSEVGALVMQRVLPLISRLRHVYVVVMEIKMWNNPVVDSLEMNGHGREG